MLLVQEPQLLLLDEPVAGMTDEETERTAELFTTLRGKHSLVVVEHDMEFVDVLTQGDGKVTVLHEGSVLAEGRCRGAGQRAGHRGLPGTMTTAMATAMTMAMAMTLTTRATGR